jgi:RNA polymerase sigma-70 factor (ECF subfamily)
MLQEQAWDDEALFIHIKESKEQAFDQFCNQFYAPLSIFIHNNIKDPQAAKDLVHDVFIKWWTHRQNFDSFKHCRWYLFTVGRNACNDYHNSKKHNTVDPREIKAMEESDIEQLLTRTVLLAQIHRHIEELPERCKEVIKLTFLEGLSTKEIAGKMRISETAVRNQKMIGIKYLKAQTNPAGDKK